MTKWKDEIDKALGSDPKFSEALQETILNKVTKRTFHWRYAVTAVSFVLVALLLFLTGPTQEQEVSAVIPFEQLIEKSTVDHFFISSSYSEREQFFARNSSRYMKVHAFKESHEANAMQHFLKSMKLVESSESFWGAKDVVVVMSNGEKLKLKIVRESSYYVVQDVYSKLVYEVKYTDSKAYDEWHEKMERSSLSIGAVLIIFAAIIGLAIMSDRLMKIQKIKREKKRNWKTISMSIVAVILINVYFNYLRANDYVMHIDIHFIAIALLTIGTQFIVQKEERSIKKKVLDWLLVTLLLVLIWILMYFG